MKQNKQICMVGTRLEKLAKHESSPQVCDVTRVTCQVFQDSGEDFTNMEELSDFLPFFLDSKIHELQ